MSKLIVHTKATAVVTEEWMLDVDDDADINTLVWNGWEAAIEAGTARKIGVIETGTRYHREREVVQVVKS